MFRINTNYVVTGVMPPSDIELLSIIVNGTLTAVLVAVYIIISRNQQKQANETMRQADLQDEVAKIQRRQTELMEQQQELSILEQRPILQVDGYRPAEPESSRYSTSAIEVIVSNIGRTPALNLKIEFITGFPQERVLSSGRSLISVRQKDEDDEWRHEWGENLEANQQNVVYVGEPLMIVWHNSDLDKTKQRAIEFMKNEDDEFRDDDRIRLKANLVYEGMGRTYSEPIFDYAVSLESYGGMRTVLEHGRPYNNPMDMPISDEIKDFEGW